MVHTLKDGKPPVPVPTSMETSSELAAAALRAASDGKSLAIIKTILPQGLATPEDSLNRHKIHMAAADGFSFDEHPGQPTPC